MVKKQILDITYMHPFAAVTTSLWAKYDGHKYVKEVDVLDRYIDSEGRLHSRRLLTMTGNLPKIFLPFVPVRDVHMVETVVVDPVKQTMHVETVNINCRSVLEARSTSSYHPTSDGTRYHIDIDVRAFPHRTETEARQQPSEEHNAAHRSWKMEWIMGGGEGYIAGKMESWVAKKLLGNVSRGEKYIEGFCRRFRERHLALCDESPHALEAAGARAAAQNKRGGGGGGRREEQARGGGGRGTLQGGGGAEGSLMEVMALNTRVARLVWPADRLRAAMAAAEER